MLRLLDRFRAAWRNSRSGLDDELRFHMQQSIEQKIASGMSPAEARRSALIEFGGIEAARETTYRLRPGWLLECFADDLRYALRGFRRAPGFAITTIAILTLGIGATTAVFSVVDPILFRPLPYSHGDRLVSLGISQSLERQEFALGGFFFDWQAAQRPFVSLTYDRAYDRNPNECGLTEATPIQLHCDPVPQSFLPTLGVNPILGRNFLPEEDLPRGPHVAILSYALWNSRFHRDPNILQRTIDLDETPTRIVGVLPANFEMPRLQPFDLLVPAQLDPAAQHTVNSGIGVPMWLTARLRPGVSIEQARAEMQPLFLHTQQWIPAPIRSDFHLVVRPLRDRQMQDSYRAAWILLVAVLFVLLIAGANAASLFSARGAARQRELAVRAALGASRRRILMQSLTEALLLVLAAALAGCALAFALLRIFLYIAPTSIPFLAQARIDLRVATVAILTALLCASFFAVVSTLEPPRLAALTAHKSAGSSRLRIRHILVVAQIAVSLVLASGAVLLVKSFRNLEAQKLGMTTHGVISVQVDLNWYRYRTSQAYRDFYLRAEAALRSLPGITNVALTDSLPPDDNSWHQGTRYDAMHVMGQPPSRQTSQDAVIVRNVTPDYFLILQIPIIAGNNFTDTESNANARHFILNALLAKRLFPNGNAVGQRIQFVTDNPKAAPEPDPTIDIIDGVAADVKNAGLSGQESPEYYNLRGRGDTGSPDNGSSWNGHFLFVLSSQVPASSIAAAIETRIAAIDPMTPVTIQPLDEMVYRLADRPRFEASLLSFFALMGIIMAIVGLYGLTAYLTTQRTQEIGIRMALGAGRVRILRLITWQGARLILLGVGIGTCASLSLTHMLRSLLFEVAPRDPETLIAVTLLLVCVAFLAMVIPVRAAILVEPVTALRCE
ncbi:ADOP family duplicated permease [Acidicapsa dinghuensis]|uniref:ADOP family duplicated permease n=1 Tax=Acidicapsa dinghuensis TaxID=2218256 RepID=A0ABW1EIP1_9BACT|nr:ABC transporter permease [Acidicapsa dinghuensis]